MYIQEVLALHNSVEAEGSHNDILGDPYLMRNNPLYKAIKRRALKIGSTFTEAMPKYLLFPFHQLGDIVATKNIPFVPSARLLQEIESKRPCILTTDDLPIPESYHLHEASHVVAEDLFMKYNLENEREKILKALVCESFANSVDALMCAYVTDEWHRFFLQQNNYMHPNKKYVDAILRLQKEVGLRFTFIYTLIVYLHANFLIEKSATDLINLVTDRFAPEARPSAKAGKDCEVLRKMTDNLDPQFRLLTTKVYLNLEGYLGEVEDLLAFPFMETFDANPAFHEVTSFLSEF